MPESDFSAAPLAGSWFVPISDAARTGLPSRVKKNCAEMSMTWHSVLIEKVDVTAADLSRAALINRFTSEGGTAADAEVWYRKDSETRHRFYFSPAAAASAPDTLRRYGSSPSDQKPDLSGFKKLRI